MQALIRKLLEAPDFPLIADQMQLVAKEEAEKRAKFLEEITPEMKAEFINGEVILHSPAKLRHLEVTLELATQFRSYTRTTGRGKVLMEKCLISLTRNDFEPDIVWFSEDKAREFQPDQMRFPAPDLVVEVLSPSTEARDRGVKMVDYAFHGVSEYWIIDSEANTLEQYVLEGEHYLLHEKRHNGALTPQCMPELKIDLDAVFS